MDDKILYTGCFFELKDINKLLNGVDRKILKNVVQRPHITLSCLPKNSSSHILYLDEEIWLKVVGYTSNKYGESLVVEFIYVPQGLKDIIDKLPVPHTITLSTGKTPSIWENSMKNLLMEIIPIGPFLLSGKYGIMYQSGLFMDTLPF